MLPTPPTSLIMQASRFSTITPPAAATPSPIVSTRSARHLKQIQFTKKEQDIQLSSRSRSTIPSTVIIVEREDRLRRSLRAQPAETSKTPTTTLLTLSSSIQMPRPLVQDNAWALRDRRTSVRQSSATLHLL